MAQRPRGPEFERAQDQRVVIGPYEPKPRPEEPAPARQTLLEKIRIRLSGGRPRDRGPRFRQPKGAGRIGRYDRDKTRDADDHPNRRPDFTDPTKR